jgi:hypothetical protein
MQPPAENLSSALAQMTFEVFPERFVLIGLAAPPAAEDLALLGEGPGQLVREGGETTWLLEESAAHDLLSRHPSARRESDLVWVRFTAPMGWEVVGFLAKVTGSLAAAGVPLGAVCGFSRDHLFLHERYLPQSLAVLRGLFPETPS